MKKIFVLDTSVILYDHQSVLSFEDNDVAIPLQVLEELDGFKKGGDSKNYEARSFIRYLNSITTDSLLNNWVNLNGKSHGKLKVVKEDQSLEVNAAKAFDEYKNDNKILNAALAVQAQFPKKKVVLVSKDICLRVKARAFNIVAEDYQTGKVKNVEELYTGISEFESVKDKVIDDLFENKSVAVGRITRKKLPYNHFMLLKNGRKSALGYYGVEEKRVQRVEKRTAFKIKPKNAEQTFALQALLDENIKLITLRGIAGSGKTLLALAAAIEQRRSFHQIYVARPIVPLSNKDIGYLPGDVKSKIDPYMQPIWDNLKFIKSQYGQKDKEYRQIEDMVNSEKIAIAPLAYIRGRTLSNVFFIVDEAQNLTPHEVKTIISRAGTNYENRLYRRHQSD
jgi:PhoH-like ATPase